jgi:hypothetical protein
MEYKHILYYVEDEVKEKKRMKNEKSQKKFSQKKRSLEKKDTQEEDYKVITISLYNEDIELINEMISTLKERGFKRLSRSKLIRLALYSLDLQKIEDNF